jgi:voltage-gated potassium channel
MAASSTRRRQAVVPFALDYAARIWTCSGTPRNPWSARLAYVCSALGVVDLLAVLPLFLEFFVRADSDWFRVLRLVAVVKVTRYAPALQLFIAVIRSESRVLLSALLAMTVIWVLVSGIIFALEHDAQPDAFSSVPQAMWWAIVTMATVGYGDIVPVTAAGRVFGGFVMVLGIASVAVPAGILATGFASELRKRRSRISWQLVAKLPLFADLEASRIAAIARLPRVRVGAALHDRHARRTRRRHVFHHLGRGRGPDPAESASAGSGSVLRRNRAAAGSPRMATVTGDRMRAARLERVRLSPAARSTPP